MRTQTINFKEFISKGKVKHGPKLNKKLIYKATIITGIATLTVFTGIDIASASNGIDAGAHILYDKLLLVGKWIIIVKGGIDTINSVVQGDLGSAKRNFLGYLVVYMVLNALPWAMNEVDTIFKQL